MSTETQEKPIALEELVGNERRWQHIAGPQYDPIPGGMAIAWCGERFIMRGMSVNVHNLPSEFGPYCPDCVRIARAWRDEIWDAANE